MTDAVQEVPISTTTSQHEREIRRIVDSAPKKAQIDKFREAARDLETDDDEARFDATLERIAKAPPPKDEKTTKDKPGQ